MTNSPLKILYLYLLINKISITYRTNHLLFILFSFKTHSIFIQFIVILVHFIKTGFSYSTHLRQFDTRQFHQFTLSFDHRFWSFKKILFTLSQVCWTNFSHLGIFWVFNEFSLVKLLKLSTFRAPFLHAYFHTRFLLRHPWFTYRRL